MRSGQSPSTGCLPLEDPFVMTPAGGGQAAPIRAAQVSSVAAGSVHATAALSHRRLQSARRLLPVNPANGTLLGTPRPRRAMRSRSCRRCPSTAPMSATVSEVGNGWSHLFRRYVSAVVPPPPGPGPPPPGHLSNSPS